MSIHDKGPSYSELTRQDIEMYIRRGRELRSAAIRGGVKRLLASLNRRSRSLRGDSAGGGNRPCTTS